MATVILTPRSGFAEADPHALAAHPIYGARPVLRGRFHQAAAVVSLPVGFALVRGASEPHERLAMLAYALTGTLMFATSAFYHRVAQGVVARFWARRLDHSMILIHIAGSTTPIATLGVGGSLGRVLLVASWGVAVTGALLKMTALTADHDPCPWFFPVLGALPLLALPALTLGIGWHGSALLVAATVTYGAGAVCFARKSPDPLPRVFGYHEVWHVFTLLAAGFQLFLTMQLAAA